MDAFYILTTFFSYRINFFRTSYWCAVVLTEACYNFTFVTKQRNNLRYNRHRDMEAADRPVCRGFCLQDRYYDNELVSINCTNIKPCIAQPCANFALCRNTDPQWVLECHGGLCVQPCDMMWGRIFEFSSFTANEHCPVCLDTGAATVVYECRHMVCAKCYGSTAFNDTAAQTMTRCPLCRHESVPRSSLRRGRSCVGRGAPIIDTLANSTDPRLE